MTEKINDKKDDKALLNKKDVQKSFWRWTFFSHSNYNYERMQSSGFLFAMNPILRKLYPNKDALEEAMKRHLEFFNTEPHFGGIIGGITIAMEEQKALGAPISGSSINSIKTGLMGPLAGVGDTLWQGTIVPIMLSFAISLSTGGNLFGPLFYVAGMFAIMWTIAYQLWMRGYYSGREGVQSILQGNQLKKVMQIAQMMGGIVIGALTVTYVTLSTPLKIHLAKSTLVVQTGILDKLFKGLLPIAITLFTYYLISKRKMKSTTVLLILILISAIGAGFYIF
ncbi:PTS system mannose/fructose/sorbose family transporter subunit IID [Lacticaseibacillus paracasei]|uniref:PTS system mannose/fructose/sorbose family transporter subunit IID n=1 Tax=Lacticaseibacillus paracasei TaxID=1597 RepID=UPI00237E56FE|nr:PTS system mannose/fructose/sorbose family transporter subunit IID [Lacticaseibacillus paracasei]MDE3289543.1 PTS system mannose/fructose/sorbose family transporter subunit IID [Lacticaseibacillus paracasei]